MVVLFAVATRDADDEAVEILNRMLVAHDRLCRPSHAEYGARRREGVELVLDGNCEGEAADAGLGQGMPSRTRRSHSTMVPPVWNAGNEATIRLPMGWSMSRAGGGGESALGWWRRGAPHR